MLLQIQGICLLLLEGCLCHQICLFLLLVAIFVVYATNHQGVCLLQLAESEDGAPHVQSIHEGYDLICFLPFELRSAAALIQLRVLLKMVFQQQNGTLRLESEFTFFPVFIVNFPLLVAAANRVARCQFAFQLRFFWQVLFWQALFWQVLLKEYLKKKNDAGCRAIPHILRKKSEPL